MSSHANQQRKLIGLIKTFDFAVGLLTPRREGRVWPEVVRFPQLSAQFDKQLIVQALLRFFFDSYASYYKVFKKNYFKLALFS